MIKRITKHPFYVRCKTGYQKYVWRVQQSGQFIVIIVYLSYFLDNMLLTVSGPLFHQHEPTEGSKGTVEKTLVRNCSTVSTIFNLTFRMNCTSMTYFKSSSNEGELFYPKYFFKSQIRENGTLFNSTVSESCFKKVLIGSKAGIYLFASPLIGFLTSRFGNVTPFFAGLLILLAESLLLVFEISFISLVVARCIHGLGSACIFIAGMAMIAEKFQKDDERSKVVGLVLGGAALGFLVGSSLIGSFGTGLMPIGIAVLIAISVVILLLVLRPRLEPERLLIESNFTKLLMDPYIILAVGAIFISSLVPTALGKSSLIWLYNFEKEKLLNPGASLVFESLGYLLGVNLFICMTFKAGRWILILSSLVTIGSCAIMSTFLLGVLPNVVMKIGLGVGFGIADATVMSLLAYLVDIRYVTLYGSVYAITQVAAALACVIGLLVATEASKAKDLQWLMLGTGLLNLLYSPLCYFIKNPPPLEESEVINMERTSCYKSIGGGRQSH